MGWPAISASAGGTGKASRRDGFWVSESTEGVLGKDNGYGLMVGGAAEAV